MSYEEEDTRDLSWQKPAWATSGPKLRSTGKDVKSGNLAKPITNIREVVQKEKPDLDFAKPDWTADAAAKERNYVDLAKPITAATSSTGFEKPNWTAEQAKERQIDNLAKPITSAPHSDEIKNSLGWKKPDWTTERQLKGTKKGEALSSGKDISRPIGGIKPVEG